MNFCPNCGTALEGNPLFCPECGAYLLNAEEKAAQSNAENRNASQPQPQQKKYYQAPVQSEQPQYYQAPVQGGQPQYYQPPVQGEQQQYYQPPTGQNQPYNTLPQQQQNAYQGYAASPNAAVPDKAKVGLVILSFLLPLIGLILFFSKRKKTPKAAKSYVIAAVIGMVMFVISSYFSEEENIDLDSYGAASSVVCEADEMPQPFDTVSQI